MKKAIYKEFGNPVEVLKVVEEPQAVLTDGQARVDVLRAPINPSDLIQVSGNYGDEEEVEEIVKNFSKGKDSEVVTLSTLEKESVSKIKAKLLSYVS